MTTDELDDPGADERAKPRASEPDSTSDTLSLAGANEGHGLIAGMQAAGADIRRIRLGGGQDDDSRQPGGVDGVGGGRLRILDELDRGGMGVVLRGRDEDLGRDVAVKVLRTGLASNPEALSRFIEEAQIAGQLQHPGIVPVYELGGRGEEPYFTMKLVKGENLAELLRSRADPTVEPHRFLTILQSICETMAYAHSRGVIHRDLKPANVMVGAYGEVLVVDWGLAKVLADDDGAGSRPQDGEAGQTLITPMADSAASLAGAVKGTPWYMPPEQAAGRVSEIDRRADVFALGAILCEILTGKAPYGGSTSEALQSAAAGDLEDAHARLQECGAEAELIKLTLACLSPAIHARPSNAGAVADAVKEHLSAKEARAIQASVRAQEERRARVQVEAALADFERLADSKRLDRLLEEAAELWPAAPEVVAPLEAWLLRAEDLLDGRDRHETTLAALCARALPYDEGQQAKDRASHPEADELASTRGQLLEARRQLAALEGGEELRSGEEGDAAPTLSSVETRIAELDVKASALEARVAERRTWLFEDSADQFMHDVLVDLVARLRGFAADSALFGSVVEVRKRREFARTVEERSLTGKEPRLAWARATAAVASHPAYDNLVLAPQIGLIPIGADSDSGLWEFCHVQTGSVPERDADGKIVRTEEMGIVLVLIPGGTFWMGAQAADESAPNYDAEAEKESSPVHQVTLSPYMISKYQMTQGQWLRATRLNPSRYGPETMVPGVQHSLLHPVETVSWLDCEKLANRLGLCLPTEAQWEYACRAGTSTPWWTGTKVEELEEAGNFLDQAFVRAGAAANAAPFDSGFVVHSPVGHFRANPWGLHDVHGNVWEWCADWQGTYDRPVLAGDGMRVVHSADIRVIRGGSFTHVPHMARSAYRAAQQPVILNLGAGVRPAMRLDEPHDAGP